MVISGFNDNLPATNSITVNLINFAMSYDSFGESEFVVFTDSDYSYYIVWGDLEKSGNSVTGGNIEYCHYYRTSTSGYTSQYTYEYGTDTSFNLTLDDTYYCTSNIPEVGFYSTVAETSETYNGILLLLVLAVSMLFAIMVKVFKEAKM